MSFTDIIILVHHFGVERKEGTPLPSKKSFLGGSEKYGSPSYLTYSPPFSSSSCNIIQNSKQNHFQFYHKDKYLSNHLSN